MKTAIVRILLAISITTFLIACENDKCPEGSEPVRDPQGHIIDCGPDFNSEAVCQKAIKELNT